MVVRNNKYKRNLSRAVRLRVKLKARAARTRHLRLSVFRSNAHFYVQLIDDSKGLTLVSASSVKKKADFSGKRSLNAAVVKSVADLFAERCADAHKDSKIIFDRGGRQCVGLVRTFADAVRSHGFKF